MATAGALAALDFAVVTGRQQTAADVTIRQPSPRAAVKATRRGYLLHTAIQRDALSFD